MSDEDLQNNSGRPPRAPTNRPPQYGWNSRRTGHVTRSRQNFVPSLPGPSLVPNPDAFPDQDQESVPAVYVTTEPETTTSSNTATASPNAAEWVPVERSRSSSEPAVRHRNTPMSTTAVASTSCRGLIRELHRGRSNSDSSIDTASLDSNSFYGRYRALSFLHDIDEPDEKGFTVLLRAIQVEVFVCNSFLTRC